MPRLQGQTLRQTALIWQMALVSWLRRYLRLTPAFAVVLAVFTTLSPYLESAPPSPTGLGHEVSLCEKHWWQNLLYVQNFLAPSAYEMCYIPCELRVSVAWPVARHWQSKTRPTNHCPPTSPIHKHPP